MGISVAIDDGGVHRHDNGDVESVAWSELAAVAIRTTALGPFVDNLHWLLRRGDGSVLVIPSEAQGVGALLERLQQLPGFDNEAVILASSSVDDALFLCWERPS